MSALSQDVARERLLDQVFDARTDAEILAAKEALRAWILVHPGEPGMADGFEVLSHREDLVSEQKNPLKDQRPASVR